MTRPTDPAKIADLIKAYESGKSIGESAAVAGVSITVANREVRKAGVWENRQRRATPPGLVEDFLGGESVKALAARHGIERSSVYRMLGEAGIDGRGRSSAMRLRWQHATDTERGAMLDAAHDTTRGRTPADAERTAIARAKGGQTMSAYERDLGAAIAAKGISVAYGVPCGRYNIDIVAGASVAVEVFGGNWHAYGRHAARFGERSRHVLDAEYDLLIVWAGKRTFDPVACAEHVVALAQLPDRNPSGRRQYRVIRGSGQVLAVREDDGNEIPLVVPFGGSDGTGA